MNIRVLELFFNLMKSYKTSNMIANRVPVCMYYHFRENRELKGRYFVILNCIDFSYFLAVNFVDVIIDVNGNRVVLKIYAILKQSKLCN